MIDETVEKDSLGSPEFVDVGEIIGFLQPVSDQPDQVSVDLTFFSDPGSSAHLGGIPARASIIFDLLAGLLPAPLPDWPPDGSPLPPTQWLPINEADDKGNPQPTGAHVVLPANHQTDAPVIGVGLFHEAKPNIAGAEITIQVYADLPFLHIDGETGISVVLGSPDSGGNPIRAGVRILGPTGTTPFGTDYKLGGIEFDAYLYLSGDNVGGFEARLIDTQPPIGDVYKTIEDLLSGNVLEYVDAVIGSKPLTAALDANLFAKIESAPSLSVGELLEAMGLLAVADKGPPVVYRTGDLSAFLHQDPLTVVEKLLHIALDKLTAYTKPIIPIEGGGLYFVKDVGSQDDDGTAPTKTSYGLRLAIPDFPVVGKDDQPGVEVLLQLGKFFTGQDSADDGWVSKAGGPALPAGVSLFLLDETGDTPSFGPRVEVVSVGIDVKKGADQPLVDLSGYILSGLEPRVFVGKTIEGDLVFGGAARLDGLGVPLGSGFGKAAGDNKVAASLLSSGDGEGGGATEGKKDAVNPAFSLSGSYLTHGDGFVVQLYDKDGTPSSQVMIPIQRAYGPLQVEKIGLGWDQTDKVFSLLFDGGVDVSALKVDLVDLSLGIPITHPTDYQLGLKGLGILFDAPPLKIVGSFVETEKQQGDEKIIEYDGVASLTFEQIGISALGSYAAVTDPQGTYTSLFIFAVLDAPIGGVPPYFFVTALAGGFGYNRGLVLPDIHNVGAYPLVAGLEDPSTFFGGGDPAAALASLGDNVPPMRGEYWIALGLKFTTFELIETSAVLSVEFGDVLEIALVGLSRIQLPSEGETLVNVELGLEVAIKPDEGFFGASAILTDNSWLLTKDCKLTGGFAFFLWYGKSDHAGDFVITIGGYNKAFPKPTYYPDIPRLGFNWTVSTAITIKGGAYFALTSTQIMLGGELEAVFQAGPLKAWFIAQMDALIGWAPFHYFLLIEVSVGVSLHIEFLFVNITLTVELGAGLTVWGPPTGGIVHVSWFIISFSIPFGAPESASTPTIDWTEYQRTLLPKPSAKKSEEPEGELTAFAATSDTTETGNVVKIVALGAPPRTEEIDGATWWIVRPDHFAFATQTAVPATTITASGNNVATFKGEDGVALRPMGLDAITSEHTVTMNGTVDGEDVHIDLTDETHWTHEVAVKSLPSAQFGAGLTPSAPSKGELVEGMLTGLMGIAPVEPKPIGPADISMKAAFTYAPVNEDNEDNLPLVAAPPVPAGSLPGELPGLGSLDQIAGSIDTSAAAPRSQVFAALLDFGFDAGTNGSMAGVAAAPSGTFESTPYVGRPITGTVS